MVDGLNPSRHLRSESSCRGYLGRGSLAQELVGAEAVLLLHGAAQDLLHAAGHHRQGGHPQPQQVAVQRGVRHRPAAS